MASAFICRRVRYPDGSWKRRTPGGRRNKRQTWTEDEVRGLEKRWHVMVRLGGRGSRTRQIGAFKAHDLALECLRRAQADLAAGRIPTAQVSRLGELTVKEAVEGYRARRKVAASTDRNYAKAIARLGRLGRVLVEAATWRDFQDWIDATSDLRPSTQRQYMWVYRRALDYCDITPNPTRDERIEFDRYEREEVTPPTWAQMRQIEERLSRPPARGRPSRYPLIVQLIERTGLRVTEASQVRWSDVDWPRRRIRVGKLRTKRTQRLQNGQRQATGRWIPITRELEPVLEELRRHSSAGGDLILGGGWTPNGLYKALLRTCEALEFAETFGPHDLRHRYLSRLVQANVPWNVIQAIAGHGNLSSLQRTYSHVLLGEPERELQELKEDVLAFIA